MPFVHRNTQGQIIALTTLASTTEFLPADDPQVIGFLHMIDVHGMNDSTLIAKAIDPNTSLRTALAKPDTRLAEMLSSDLKMIRVIEDVVDILMAKNMMIFSDLPDAVQQKLLQQKGRREKLFGSGGDILSQEDGIL